MNNRFAYGIVCSIAILSSAQAKNGWGHFEEEIECMHKRMDRMESIMRELFEDDLSTVRSHKSTTFSVSRESDLLTISSELPGLEKVDAKINDKDQSLRISGKKGDNVVVDILVQKNIVYASVGYEHREEQTTKHNSKSISESYYYANYASSLPAQVDISNPAAIKVKYAKNTLTVSMPIVGPSVHTISVDMQDETEEEKVDIKKELVNANHLDTQDPIEKELTVISKELADY